MMNDFLFYACFMDQPHAALREISQSAVKQSTGTAAGAEREIVLLDETNAQPAHGGVAGDAGTDNSAADDEQVQWLFDERLDGFSA